MVIDENGNEVANPDLTVGEIVHVRRPRADAVMVDGMWPDGSFEEVELYRPLTPEAIAARATMARRENIADELDDYMYDTDVALLDLDAAQYLYETDTDAALFDLVDYVASLEARIAELEAING